MSQLRILAQRRERVPGRFWLSPRVGRDAGGVLEMPVSCGVKKGETHRRQGEENSD